MACELENKTDNPICSDSLQDLKNNTIIMDQYINSEEFVVPDRLGIPRKTWAGLEKDVQDALVNLDQEIADKIIAQGGVEITDEFGDSLFKVINQRLVSLGFSKINGVNIPLYGDSYIKNNDNKLTLPNHSGELATDNIINNRINYQSKKKKIVFNRGHVTPVDAWLRSITDRYPQAIAVHDDLIYSATGGPVVVVVYRLSTSEFVTAFRPLGADWGSESIPINIENGRKYMYLRGSGDNLLKYDITELPDPESEIPFISTGLKTTRAFGLMGDKALLGSTLQQRNDVVSRGDFLYFRVSDKKLSGSIKISPMFMGILEGREWSDLSHKSQGLCLTDDGIASVSGGIYRPSIMPDYTPYYDQGVFIFDNFGNYTCDNICNGYHMYNTIRQNLSLTTAEMDRIEMEGISFHDNKIYTQAITSAGTSPYAVILFEEFYNGIDGIDFSGGEMPPPIVLEGDLQRVSLSNSGYINPFTGELSTDFTELLNIMAEAEINELSWYSSNILIQSDLLPLVNGQFITLNNVGNGVIECTVKSLTGVEFKRYLRVDGNFTLYRTGNIPRSTPS